MQGENQPSSPETPTPQGPVWVMQAPPPRRRFGIFGILAVLIGGVFLGSSMSTCAAMRAGHEGPFAEDGPRVGVVEVFGTITGAKEVVQALRRFQKNDDIEAVVLRVDSPGGSVGPSQEIFDAVRRAAADKPVVASMGSMAASGGYWVSLGADEIFANPGTLTGSIGVIVQIPDLTGVAEALRFDMRTYKSGPRKDLGNPFEPEDETHVEVFQAVIEDIQAQFVDLTAERRGLDRADVEALADGRVMTGRDAREVGLVDRLGGLVSAAERALALARERDAASVAEGERPILVYPPEPVPSLLDLLGARMGAAVADGVRAGAVEGARDALAPQVELR